MKRVLYIFSLIGITIIIFLLRSNDTVIIKPAIPITPTITSTPSKSAQTILFQNQEYAYEYFIVENYKTIQLIPNFETPATTETLVTENTCKDAINAGFYKRNNTPIGLWKNDDTTLGNAETNTFLNGFYSIQNGGAAISYVEPNKPRIAFQTGPILVNDTLPVKLAIRNDEPARRMIIGVTKSGSSMFMTVYDPLSPLRGPYLNDLPAVTRMITQRIQTPLTMALNLDGGSASAFYSENKGMWEINPVGSLLCVTE